jgi:hypothetical protein
LRMGGSAQKSHHLGSQVQNERYFFATRRFLP